jgi:hypothetical protein
MLPQTFPGGRKAYCSAECFNFDHDATDNAIQDKMEEQSNHSKECS